MKTFIIILVAVGVAVCGCASIDAQKDFKGLRPGMTQEELIQHFGEEPVERGRKNDQDLLYYFAYTQTPSNTHKYFLAFEDDQLVEWGRWVNPNAAKKSFNSHVVFPVPTAD